MTKFALALTLVALVALSGPTGAVQAPEKPVQKVDVLAERFQFTPSEIKTTVGTVLEIRLTSDDTAHGFRIVGTDVDLEIPKRNRGTATVTFEPQAAGRYTFECSQLCGAGHAFMRGVIVVSEAPARK
jgi:cytochrome c oxidase subunit 2